MQSDIDHTWYPFTQMTDLPNDSFKVIDRGQGSYLFDKDGKKYLDAYASLWVNVHGHNHPKINKSISDQLSKLAHSTLLGSSNQLAIDLSAKLREVSPVRNAKVFYSDSGSTSVEIGIKLAFQYWQNKGVHSKNKFLSLENAYHGDTLGMIGLGGIDLFHEVYGPLIIASIKTPPPYESFNEDEYAENISKLTCIFENRSDEIAAFIVEPIVQGAAGILRIKDGYLKKVSELCKQYDVLLVIDEVATGFGKTGKMFACDHEGVQPDILCLAKGITGGYLPLAATVADGKIYEAFLADYVDFKTFFHGHSYTGNPLACSAALANLEIFDDENVLDHVQKMIPIMSSELKLLEKLDVVFETRGIGLMNGVEIRKNKISKEYYPIGERIAQKICNKCVEDGVMLRPLGNVIPIIPPLCINEEEIKFLFDVLKESIIKITKE
ncbi:MAG: adenosylmethionine--8-amino-7-oxononanoate transaminase [Planctomycetota bacterium]|nr:MAG: adenosylmethionine--8-amino-7-oxononanoate transaminase [Planctomycetota bacterium]